MNIGLRKQVYLILIDPLELARSKPRKLIIIIIIMFFIPPSSFAQVPVADPTEAPSETMELIKEEESVSIAARHEQPISEAPANVWVITDEDIRHSGAIDLPTILRRIPGMEVMQMTGADFDVSVRGDNQTLANKILVLVDGRSIYEDIQGQVWWKGIPVTLPEIKRIEVLKGPASVLYGFNAFDGVINIITKSSAEMKGTTIQFGGGEYGTISSAAVQAGSYKNWGYRLSVGRDQTNQWRDRDALAFRDNKFNGQFEYTPGDGSKVTITGGLVDMNRFDGPVFDVLRPATTVVNGHANVLYERPNFFVRAWWQSWNHDQTFSVDPHVSRFFSIIDRNGNPFSTTRQDSYNLEGQHAVELAASNRLTYGFNYRHNTGSSNVLSHFTEEDRLGFYVQDEWKATRALTAVAGVRYDLDTFINPTYSPRGALIYKLVENHTLRLSGSVAYRPPTMFETNSDARSSVSIPGVPQPRAGALTGSANVEPEKIVSYEFGYQGWFLRHRLRVRGDIFFNHITDLIVRTAVSPTTRSFLNNGTADIHGLEAGIEFQATSWLSGYVNYTYEAINQTITIPDLRRGAPRDKINAGFRGEWANGFSADVNVNYVSDASYPVSQSFSQFAAPPFRGPPPPNTQVGSYTLLNLRVAYSFWRDKAELAFAVFNALNDKHMENPLGDTIGSRAMGWLTVKY